MNIIKRELLSYRKQTIYWSIGMLLLLLVAFYKVSGMNSAPGGMEAMLQALPPMLQVMFGAGAVDYATGVGTYSMIHLYICIALALHAVILGATIFAKEEQDRTCEFLYVKGVKRWQILMRKLIAGLSLLIFLDVICFLGIIISTLSMGLTLTITDLLPYLFSLLLLQVFFFTFALLLSIILPNSQKAGMIGCCIVLGMFLISMYAKIGGNIDALEKLSLFHYSDAAYIRSNAYGGMNSLIIVLLAIAFFGISGQLHEHRDLLS